ncbi:PREDICTED: uncharacterized protein LOC105568515 [Vollenhovia emeryi]|uniref:uncharacterized protein LOC105568515 n=1 Tax=Vollenhovia emeryi TaxID=411798 RepID=UPI0005F3D650|nr:PREDICTED: uncharacterized protein LOC105568515 [Vollenhovia emeryi]
MQIYRTLETLERPVSTWDDFLVFITVQRLDAETLPDLSLQAFEKSRTGKLTSNAPQNPVKAHYNGKSRDVAPHNSKACLLCSDNHYIASCPQYVTKSTPQRIELVKRKKLCYNCLGTHKISACRVTKRCFKCGSKHHTSIHTDKSQPTTSKKEDAKTTESAATTATVVIVTPNEETTTIRALIDQGSEVSLISERVVQRLHLPRSHSSIPLIGIGAQNSYRTKGIVRLTLRAHFDNSHEFSCQAHVLRKLTTSIPSGKIESPSWPHLEGLQLADPEFLSPRAVDIILGADIYGHIIQRKIKKGPPNTPIAQLTKLGWIISGPTSLNRATTSGYSYHVSVNEDLYNLLHRFWQLEEIPSLNTSSLSVDEQECETHFQSTCTRDSHGRYVVRLPFKQSSTQLGESRSKAFRIMNHLSRKFTTNSNYAQAYFEFISEYERLQHMQLVPESQQEPCHAY